MLVPKKLLPALLIEAGVSLHQWNGAVFCPPPSQHLASCILSFCVAGSCLCIAFAGFPLWSPLWFTSLGIVRSLGRAEISRNRRGFFTCHVTD